MLKLYGFIRSRSNRPHWALEELEVPYTFYQLDFSKGDSRSAAFHAINSGGKIPTLLDGDLVLTESVAICNYLAEKFPEKGLIPASGTIERAKYDEWMLFQLGQQEQPLWSKGKHTFALPEEVRIPAMLETATFEFKRAVDLAAEKLGDRTWCVGDSFSMVDIVLAHTLRWAVSFEFKHEHANLTAFLERMEARPAFQRMLNSEKLDFPR